MTKLTITGNKQPIVGDTEAYSLSVFDHIMTSNPFSFSSPKVQWNIHVQNKKGWRVTDGNRKEGERVTYKFTSRSLKYKALKIEVVRGKDRGELYIKPKEAESPKIISVELLDINSKVLLKGKRLHYTDTIIARAHCVGMFGQKVSFTLWEDDAIGKGHDPIINMVNKINQIPLVGEVDYEGIAKVVFRLPVYTMAAQIANAGVARGDKNEGETHEYYVTAEVISKHILKASPNVNVMNPTHTLPSHRKPPVASGNSGTQPNKPKPKEETAKFPQTPAAKKQADSEGKILSAEFTDGTGKSLKNAKTGDVISIKIVSQTMKGKNVMVRIWEEDLSRYSNDLLYEKSVTLAYDTTNFINGVSLTKEMYDKSNDMGEGNEREYFIEVEHLNTSVTSRVIPISPNAEPVKMEANDSPAIIKEVKLPIKNCGGKYCIDKNSPPSELIREINIRLAGFGGNVPTDQFTDRTEKMIKQFQRDYMKVPETGKVCGNVLRAIDEFCLKWTENIKNYLCLCKNEKAIKNKCSGFGKGQYKDQYSNKNQVEKYYKYERPGIHRSLLWGVSALKYYLSTQKKYKYHNITAGYRCWEHNMLKDRKTTNHMGKAVDLQFSKNGHAITGKNQSNIPLLEEIRDNFFTKYLDTKYQWVNGTNNFSLEPFGLGSGQTWSWVHMDVREFENIHLEDKYFTKAQDKIIGKNITQFAIELGFKNICNCSKGFESIAELKEENTIIRSCEDKFKKIAPIILQHEGGYVNHKSDKGGATNKGITLTTWKQYAKEDLNIEPTLDNLKKITDEQASKIYRKRYWEPKGFCGIEDEKVGLMIYDWTITSGGAGKQVQRLLKNEFGQNVEVDGAIGSLTIDAINNVEDQDKLLNRLAEVRKQYYTNLTYTDGKKNDQDVFLQGWLNRVDNCLKFKP